MSDSVLRTALLLKSANSECNLNESGHHMSGCTIDPNNPEDQVFIQKAEEFLNLDISIL